MFKYCAVLSGIMASKKGVGLAFGGGGARGFFHLGVIRALQELEIPVREVSGASIGAVVGAIYCSDPGFDTGALLEDFSFIRIAGLSAGKGGLIDSGKIRSYLEKFLDVRSFSRLRIPLRISSSDLMTAEEVVLDSGLVVPAVMASISIPGIFPVRKYRGRFLCDGGLVDNLPVSLLGSERILASDCSPSLDVVFRKPDSVSVAKANVLIPQKRLSDISLARKKGSDVVVFRLGGGMELLDFRRSMLADVEKKGYSCVMGKRRLLLRRFR